MSCNRGVSCSSSEILSIFVWDVLTLAILVALGKTEVDDINSVASVFSSANKEVIRFNVTMDYSFFMDFLHMTH